MANGFFLGGFGSGLSGARQQALQRDQFGLMQQQQAFEQDRSLATDATKAIGDTMTFVGQAIESLKKSGASPAKIQSVIEPLLKDVEQIAGGVGMDPSRFRRAVDASLATPVEQEKTPEQKQDEKLALEVRERQKRKELGLPVKGEDKGGDDIGNASDRKVAGFASNMIEAEAGLAALETSGAPIDGILARAAPEEYRNFFRRPEGQVYLQRAMQWIRAKLRKESGAQIAQDEFDGEFRTFFPQPGDSPEVVKRKKEARAQAIRSLITEAGPAGKGLSAPSPASSPGGILTIDLNGNPIQ